MIVGQAGGLLRLDGNFRARVDQPAFALVERRHRSRHPKLDKDEQQREEERDGEDAARERKVIAAEGEQRELDDEVDREREAVCRGEEATEA